MSTHDVTVPLAPQAWSGVPQIGRRHWQEVPVLTPFIRADDSGPARQQTVVRICCDLQALYVHFDCHDLDIWGTFTERDEPLYAEEVVEVFLAPGADAPTRYFEFEVSPNGVLFDAVIINPRSKRAEIEVRPDWDCDGVRWYASRDDAHNQWTAALAIPWAPLLPDDDLPSCWRANFCRIERPRNAEPEFSCWSATMTHPADFHKPARFGTLRLPALME